MPEDGPAAGGEWDALVDALYSAPPEGFVAARDDAVRAARERGDREFATAAARLRRPTRAAWLANLLARRRPEQLAGLLGLAGSLADAQRTLDGSALRALSAQRRKLVTAMAREAGQLAREAHEPAGDALVREVAEILEAALADPVVADEVRSGRLTRTVSYTGFGPPADTGAAPRPAPPPPPPASPPAGTEPPEPPEADDAAAEARRREEEAARRREQEARRTELADAERDEQRARERRDAAEAARDTTAADHDTARERVAALTAELEAARERERDTAGRARDADAAARAAARDAGTAATRTARARARLEEMD